MKIFKKLLFFFILVIIIILSVYYYNNWSVNKRNQEKNDLITRISEFNILDEDLDESLVDKYKELFIEKRDLFLENPDSLSIFNNLLDMGIYKQLVGDYYGAEEIWLYASTLFSESPALNGNLAHLYKYFIHDFNKAEEFYLKALEVAGVNHYTHFHELYGLYRYQLEDKEKTVDILSRAIIEMPNNINIYLLSAHYYEDISDINKAIYYYNKALEINPDSEVAINGLNKIQ